MLISDHGPLLISPSHSPIVPLWHHCTQRPDLPFPVVVLGPGRYLCVPGTICPASVIKSPSPAQMIVTSLVMTQWASRSNSGNTASRNTWPSGSQSGYHTLASLQLGCWHAICWLWKETGRSIGGNNGNVVRSFEPLSSVMRTFYFRSYCYFQNILFQIIFLFNTGIKQGGLVILDSVEIVLLGK